MYLAKHLMLVIVHPSSFLYPQAQQINIFLLSLFWIKGMVTPCTRAMKEIQENKKHTIAGTNV